MRAIAAGTLLALLPSPGQAIDFGCYANAYECGGVAEWPANVARMRAAGMTTAVIWARSRADLTFEVDAMIEGGMLSSGVPLLVIAEIPSDRAVNVIPLSGFANGEMETAAEALLTARDEARFPDRWPELYVYGPDEPGHGEPGADVSGVGLVTEAWNRLGLKCGTAVEGANVADCLPLLDLIAVAAEDGYPTARDVASLKASGRGFWVYDAALVKRKPWTLGVQMTRWCAWNPDCYLFWSWQTLVAQPPGYVDQWLWAFCEAAEEINRVQNHILPGVPR